MNTFKTSEQLNELFAALSKAQGEIDNVITEQKAYNYNYADLGQVIKSVKKPLADNELSVIQAPFSHVDESGVVRDGVSTRIGHSSGQWIESSMIAPAGSGGKMSAIQNIGSHITYMRRYMLAAMTGVAQVDDESELVNEKPKAKPTINGERFKKMILAIKEGKYSKEAALSTYNLSDEQIEEVENAS